VSIAREQKRFIDRMVKEGNYVSSGEVVRDGLRLLQEREHVQKLRVEEIRKQIQKSMDALEGRDYIRLDREGLKDFVEKFKREGLRRLNARRRRK
jgi:putative addiction module CopG family antidote